MGLKVEVKCSLCGGRNSFPEDSYAFKCRFCGSGLHVTGADSVLSYRLSPRLKPEEVSLKLKKALLKKGLGNVSIGSAPVLLYIPFWRLRSKLFCWLGKDIKFKSVDLSLPANESLPAGVRSLGLRTAALPLKIFNPKLYKKGVVMPVEKGQNRAWDRARERALWGLDLGAGEADPSEMRLVGSVMSIVHLPVYAVRVEQSGAGRVLFMDGVSLKVTGVADDLDSEGLEDLASRGPRRMLGTMGLIPFRCMNCGWDLPLKPYSRIHVCTNCGRAQREHAGRFLGVPYNVVAKKDAERPEHFLPYWRLRVEVATEKGLLATVGDLRGVFPNILPRRREAPPESSIYFYVPAFKIKSIRAFHRAASQLSKAQPPISFKNDDYALVDQRGVTDPFMGIEEASEMMRILFLGFVPPLNKKLRRLARGSRVKVLSARLIFFPYTTMKYQLRDMATGVTVPRGTTVLDGPAA